MAAIDYGVLTASPWRWLEHAWWVVFEDACLIVSCLRSVSEMRRIGAREMQLSYGAYHDALTGLANRRLLSERFEYGLAIGHDREGAVLFLDLDRFKQVNDTLGHGVGDTLSSASPTFCTRAISSRAWAATNSWFCWIARAALAAYGRRAVIPEQA